MTYSLLLSYCLVVGMKSIARLSFARVCVTQETKLLCGHYCTPTALSFAFTSDWHHRYINVKTFNVESRAARACRVDRRGLHWEYVVSGRANLNLCWSVWQHSFFILTVIVKNLKHNLNGVFHDFCLDQAGIVSREMSTLFCSFAWKNDKKSWTSSLPQPVELILKSCA